MIAASLPRLVLLAAGAVSCLCLPATGLGQTPRIPTFPIANSDFSAYSPAYPDSSGRNVAQWLGGDIPTGVYIGNNYSFWGFSDTFLGNPTNTLLRHNGAIGNSIAIGQTTPSINNGAFTPFYFYSGTLASPQPFFGSFLQNAVEPGNPHGQFYRFNVGKAIMVQGKLFVFLQLRYVDDGYYMNRDPVLTSGGQSDQGEFLGTFLARVNNPTDLPTGWNIDYMPFYTTQPGTWCPLFLGREAIPGADGLNLWVYGSYTTFNSSGQANYAADTVHLVSYDAMMNATNGQYIAQSGVQHLSAGPNNASPSWQPAYIDYDATTGSPRFYNCILPTGVFSIRTNWTARDAANNPQWQVVGVKGLSSSPLNDPHAYVYMNPSPIGPFGLPPTFSAAIYTFPEFAPGWPGGSDQTPTNQRYCYGLKEWVDPQLTDDYHIAFTYTYDNTRDIFANPTDPLNRLNNFQAYENHQWIVPNPFFTQQRAAAAGADPVMAAVEHLVGKQFGALAAAAVKTEGLAAKPAAHNDGPADPLKAPGVPPRLNFPVQVHRPTVLKRPWNVKTVGGRHPALRLTD